jgi:CheY-like chemotaxis protein
MSAILLVDDNPAVRNIVGDVLRDLGHKVVEASSGAGALDLLERNTFDLLVLDYLLPDMKGDAVARLVGERWDRMRIAFLTGYSEFLELTGKHGGNVIIPKPITTDALCRAVEDTLRRPAAPLAA